jgi:hypothetical protein
MERTFASEIMSPARIADDTRNQGIGDRKAEHHWL